MGSGGDYNPYEPPATAEDEPAPATDPRDMYVAERGSRFLARLFDLLMTFACAVIPRWLVKTVDGDPGEGSFAAAVGGLFALMFLGYQWYLIAATGQSLAKRFLRIKIVKMDGSSPGFVSGVLLREWLLGAIGLIPTIGPVIGLANSLWIFGGERRCIHDLIAGTRVVRVVAY